MRPNLRRKLKLIIYKKGLYNANTATEDELLSILNPLIKNENLWKSHSIIFNC